LLRAGMDDVTYAPGTPNVLSMTKRLGAPAAEVVPGAPVRSAAEDPGARCLRSDDGDETVLAIDGVLDATTTSAVAATLDALVAERRPSVTVDLSSLHAVDSAGVASLVRLRSRCRSFGGTVRVVGLTRQPRALFRLLHADDPPTAS
jgi:anti-anti-sigma factor